MNMAWSAASRSRSPGVTAMPTACWAPTATRRRRFGDDDVAFLVAVANVLAGAIQRNQLNYNNARN